MLLKVALQSEKSVSLEPQDGCVKMAGADTKQALKKRQRRQRGKKCLSLRRRLSADLVNSQGREEGVESFAARTEFSFVFCFDVLPSLSLLGSRPFSTDAWASGWSGA